MFFKVIVVCCVLGIEATIFEDLAHLDFAKYFDLDLHSRGLRDLSVSVNLKSGGLLRPSAPTKRPFIWTHIIKDLADKDFNISLVAWQNVYDSEGKIVQNEVVELAFPVKNTSRDIWSSFAEGVDEKPTRSDQHKVIKNLAPFVKLNKLNSFTSNVFVEGWTEDGEEDFRFFWNGDTTYFRVDGLTSFNKTTVTTKDQIVAFEKNLEETFRETRGRDFYLEPLRLYFDTDGNSNHNKTVITGPSVVGYVVDFWEASDAIILGGPLVFTKVVLSNKRENIPRELAKAFDEKFPEYEWRVLVDNSHFHGPRDVWIKLSVDGFEFYEGEKPTYLVYGVEK